MEIAREAGALLREYEKNRPAFEMKGEFDLVTEADRRSEELVVRAIESRYPGHAILGEEGGDRAGNSEYRWYVDPLDGTTNFAHGFPVFNVSIGLEHKGELICGVIYDPTRDELFAAERGAGARLNGQPVHVSRAGHLEDSLVATGFPSRKRHQNVNVHFFYQMAMITHGVRRPGAAAIDLAYVACGRLDAFWEFGLNPWDVAAGALLIEEAGGTVTDMHGEKWHLRSPHLLATNTLLHRETLELFAEIFAGRYRVPMVEIPLR